MNKAAEHTAKATEDGMGISLWIDTYDDIFSDFDPRPFHERNISDDFLSELRKFSWEKERAITGFTLLIPKSARDPEKETVIIKRLNHYFKKSHHTFLQKKKTERNKGIRRISIGIILMIMASYISLVKSDSFFMHTLLVLTEPAGWFLVWSGLEIFQNSTSGIIPELTFFGKLTKSKIEFVEY